MRIFLALGLLTSAVAAAEPPAAVAKAVAAATDALTGNKPRAAVDALEAVLPSTDPNVRKLLLEAYSEELKTLRLSKTPDAVRIETVKEKLAALTAPPAAKATGTDLLDAAAAAFRDASTAPGKYVEAAALFAKAMDQKVELSAKQSAAWAYCRVRVAAERFNANPGDTGVAAEVAAEVAEALRLAPDHGELQQFGRKVLAAAGQPAPTVIPAAATAPAGEWQLLEAGSVQVRFVGDAGFAGQVAKKADAERAAIFAKWSGPAGGAWSPKCEIVIHPTAAAFAAATKQPATATGHAFVKLENGKAADRRIDLRADDAALLETTLPRELAHVVLADLFPDAAPPRWAVEAVAVLSAGDADRVLRTVARVDAAGELPAAGALLTAAEFPAGAGFTGHYVAGVSFADFLVRWKGEKAFTTFLRDCKRYGAESAMTRQYGVTGAAQMNDLWRKNVLAGPR